MSMYELIEFRMSSAGDSARNEMLGQGTELVDAYGCGEAARAGT